MEVIIRGEAKEIAALVLATQGRRVAYTEKESLANTYGSDNADGITCIPLGEIYEFRTNGTGLNGGRNWKIPAGLSVAAIVLSLIAIIGKLVK